MENNKITWCWIGYENMPIVICRYRQIPSYFWRYFADIGTILRTFPFFADRKHFSKKLKMVENFDIISHLFISINSSYFRYISDLICIYFLYFYFIFLFMNYIIDWWKFKNEGDLKELKMKLNDENWKINDVTNNYLDSYKIYEIVFNEFQFTFQYQ